MEVHEALPICISNGLKVYPVFKNGMMYVAVEKDKKVKLGTVAHSQKTINKAIAQTLVYLAQKIEGNNPN